MDDEKPVSSKNKILLDQVEDLYSNLNYANWSVILISSFMVWVLWLVAPLDKLMFWDAYILGIVLAREHGATLYRRGRITEENVNLWLKFYIAGVFLSGIGWGVLLIFVVPPNESIHLIVTVFLLCGLVTGSAATLASMKYGFAVFSVPAILPGAIYLIYLNGPVTFVVGCTLFFFLVFILLIALRMHTTIYYSLKTQVEVSNKLSVLEVEKNELEFKIVRLQDQLEFEKNEVEQLKASLNHKQPTGGMGRRAGDVKDGRFVSLLENLQGGVWDLNMGTGEMTYSEGWLAIMGYDRKDAPNHIEFWESVLHPDDKVTVINKLHAFAEGTKNEFSSSHRLKTRSGKWIWVMARAHGVIWGGNGELLNFVGMEICLPDSSESVKKSLDLLNFDLNAWIFSEECFHDRLQQLVKTASVDGIKHSLCQLKIVQMSDQFRQDRTLEEIFLYEVGRVLLNEFRKGDAILCEGNESFILLLEFCSVEDAWEKTLILQRAFQALLINFKGAKYKVTVAIGVTPIASDDIPIAEILQDAETACELAISETSNLIYIYQKDNHEIGANLFEKHIANRIKECIDRQEIGISAIPFRALSTSANKEKIYSISYKLKEKMGENFPGADYKAIARKNHLLPELDKFVIKHLFEWLKYADGGSAGNSDVYLYECSENSLCNAGFLEFVLKELELHPDLNHSVCFGISEKLCMDLPEAMRTFVEEVKSAGSRIAMTDIGNSAISVQLLKEYRMDFMKFEQSFIENLGKDQANLITFKYINDISHLAGVKSIVENSDDVTLLDTFNTISIDFMQGNSKDSPGLVIK